ncbi:hypothetical protein MYX84_14070 [Acidobacteria bacterium AH-259-O06]|nr:hypothetical protein [Acidobacteria bacterium AH-259-O06]
MEKTPESDFRVYAIWFNVLWTDSQSKWDDDLLSDPRVLHFWDEEKIVGLWYEQHVTRLGQQGARRVEWDAYFLYHPDAIWAEQVPRVVSWGRTIVAKRKQLQHDLLELLQHGRVAARASP